MLLCVWPEVQTYDAAPLAVKVAELPWQILALLFVIITFGSADTVTVTDALAEQPFGLVPVTV